MIKRSKTTEEARMLPEIEMDKLHQDIRKGLEQADIFIRERENEIIELKQQLEAIAQILDGGDKVSDFMLSFRVVRKASDIMHRFEYPNV